MLDFNQRHQQLSGWVKQSTGAGWLTEQAQAQLDQLETARAEQLFNNTAIRPLIVAFFGGTGTGKSSLLNRLADAEIAITGVARPTSHEVTIYLHQDHQLNESLTSLPMQQTRIHYHQLVQRQQVAWLDMPDFDSVESANRDLVEQWLPYIDYLVYVVSPERYHDDLGWQILQQRQQRHQWLFVMNHWDEGKPEQFDDFRSKLNQAGFSKAELLRTSCTATQVDDEFAQLEAHLNQAIETNGIEQLQKTGALARLQDLEKLIAEYQQTIGTQTQWQTWSKSKQTLSNTQSKGLVSLLRDQSLGLIQPLQALEEDASWFKSKQNPTSLPSTSDMLEHLTNQRCGNYLQRMVREQAHHCLDHKLPDQPLSKRLSNLTEETIQTLEDNMTTATATAMAKPGTLIQRTVYKLCGWLGFLLPLGLAIWSGWFLLAQYREGMQGTAEFLGTGFITNTLMLMGLGWFIPWLIKRKIQPSLISSFKRGVINAIEQTGIEFEQALNLASEKVIEEHNGVQKQLAQLQQKIPALEEL